MITECIETDCHELTDGADYLCEKHHQEYVDKCRKIAERELSLDEFEEAMSET